MEQIEESIAYNIEFLISILPYYGYKLEWRFLLNFLNTKTRKIWKENQDKFKYLAKKNPATIIKMHTFDDNVIQRANKYIYYQLSISTEDELSKLKSLLISPSNHMSFRILYVSLSWPLHIFGSTFYSKCDIDPFTTKFIPVPDLLQSFPDFNMPDPGAAYYFTQCLHRQMFEDQKFSFLFTFFRMYNKYRVCLNDCYSKSNGRIDCIPRYIQGPLSNSYRIKGIELPASCKKYTRAVKAKSKFLDELFVKRLIFNANERGVRARELVIELKRGQRIQQVAGGNYNVERVCIRTNDCGYWCNSGFWSIVSEGWVYYIEKIGEVEKNEKEANFEDIIEDDEFIVFKSKEVDFRFRFMKFKAEKIKAKIITSKSWSHCGKELYNMHDPGYVTIK